MIKDTYYNPFLQNNLPISALVWSTEHLLWKTTMAICLQQSWQNTTSSDNLNSSFAWKLTIFTHFHSHLIVAVSQTLSLSPKTCWQSACDFIQPRYDQNDTKLLFWVQQLKLYTLRSNFITLFLKTMHPQVDGLFCNVFAELCKYCTWWH